MAKHTTKSPPKLTILGGGPAGLSVGYFAKLQHLDFTIFEANSHTGGNCVTYSKTLEGQIFRYDSGAHRLHDRIPHVTDMVRDWLGHDLLHVTAPSQIYDNGSFLGFPLSPLDFMRHIGFKKFLKSSSEVLQNRYKDSKTEFENFEAYTRSKYGTFIAEQYLLNYSEKLWGIHPSELNISVAGNRLKGFTLRAFLLESFFGDQSKTQHLDGSFHYPRLGYGMLTKELFNRIGLEKTQLNSKITAVFCSDNRIKSIEVNESKQRLSVDHVVSTLPISLLANIMVPHPPEEILAITKKIKFRSLLLVVFFLDREQVSSNATIYFPQQSVPFTRVYEPKNRSKDMSPPEKTSIVVEIPTYQSDSLWQMNDKELSQVILTHAVKLGLFQIGELIGSDVKRMPYAYPILTTDIHKQLPLVIEYFQQFENLTLFGRNGLFEYIHLHHLLLNGEEFINNFSETSSKENEY